MKSNNKATNFIKDVLLSTLYAVVISVIMVLILALIIKYVAIGDNVLIIINQMIKIISILSGLLIGLRTIEAGAAKGAVVGLLYVLITIMTFSLLEGGFALKSFNLIDILLAVALGGISGILSVNIKSK